MSYWKGHSHEGEIGFLGLVLDSLSDQLVLSVVYHHPKVIFIYQH